MAQETDLQPVRRLSYFHDALSLYTVDFPVFYTESISERHVIIAGGGGSSKTGVHNQINILELLPSNGSCYATLVAKFRDIPDAIMSGSLMKDLPIAQSKLITAGSQPTIYQLSFNSTNNQFTVGKHEVLANAKAKSEVKCVKYANGKVFAGRMDGYLTVWDDNESTSDIKAHHKEIDEIDVDMINEHILTLSRGEGRLVLWNLNNFKPIKELSNKDLQKVPGVTYCLRSCKYAHEITNKSAVPSLLIACNPIPAKSQSCLLRKACMRDNDLIVTLDRFVDADGIMAMTVDQDGRLAAIGTRSGGVFVIEIKTLDQIYSINGAHHNAVTDLTFLPPTQETLTLTNSELCTLLSVSIDRRIILHRPKVQSLPSKWFKYVLITIVIYLLFFIVTRQVSA